MPGKIGIWARKHKKGLIIAGTLLGAFGTIAIAVVNGKRIRLPVANLTKSIVPEVAEDSSSLKNLATVGNSVVSTTCDLADNVAVNADTVIKTFSRSEFIRHLHDGWNASPAKLAQAAKLGITLNPGETLVNACTVSMKAA